MDADSTDYSDDTEDSDTAFDRSLTQIRDMRRFLKADASSSVFVGLVVNTQSLIANWCTYGTSKPIKPREFFFLM